MTEFINTNTEILEQVTAMDIESRRYESLISKMNQNIRNSGTEMNLHDKVQSV